MTVTDVITGEAITFTWFGISMAVVAGLVAGTLVGLLTEWYTATNRSPVETIVNALADRLGDYRYSGYRQSA